MQLFYSATSPYARKVMVCALLRGLGDRIERIDVSPDLSPPELLAQNPLSKVPCLVTVEGLPVYDSPVICEYLDGLGTARPLFPKPGPERTGALVMQALADGIMDAALLRRIQQPFPQDEGRQKAGGRAQAAIARALDVLEAAPPQGLRDIGAVAVACALGYLDLRFADEPWREEHPKLAAWFAEVSRHPALAETEPA
ncbi:glutathione S-transferase [Pseudoroseomonas wenyumeiae]|uniref:Glutathione S-transferase n=1 Tax=Teichococcus wenyumeiae TaxID=2478470 RepID=A0A3A9J611_9PROT|nr:glutathione S-transferase [Pseudoroseomonas wenyumeiae]RKK01350.1 glutathione S-transferase [Pseudoroseomonas wenyumeiae]RMI24731.1 glutathione S-transferase [Pseudoroseomonas wenyumeiae]